jgi:phosphoglycolate phosphatase-like HAD superfamily hydrolase
MPGSDTDRRLTGSLITGLGVGAGFTSLAWFREDCIAAFGIAPHPGTLNLQITRAGDLRRWEARLAEPCLRLVPPEQGSCDALAVPVEIAGRLPGAVIVPQVPGYPTHQLEVIAALPLREYLGLADGDPVQLELLAPMAAEALIFDVDGTLVNSVDAYHIAAGLAAEPHGLEVTRELVHQALNSQQPFWSLILPPERQADRALVQSLRDETMRHWPTVLAEHVDVFPRLGDTLERLRVAGLRLAIYTGSRGESFEPLRRAGLLELFEIVLTAADVAQPKPHPEGVLHCLTELGVTAPAAAYVGDSSPDMHAARAAGVTPVGVLSGAGNSASLSEAGARHLVRSHESLLKLLNLQ